ncbi:MAG: PKD domain-containing protein [Luteolibacter sp.]
MKVYEEGTEKLTVYTDVPGHAGSMINGYASRAKSDIYEIWVRSAASNNQWVQCFANMTYNRGQEMPYIYDSPTTNHAYQKFTAGWSHTYANIEMSENSPVEVEIRKIGNTTLDGSSVIVKSAVHPAHKVVAGSKFDANGRVYFKIDKPCQVVIDINGQMDDHNAAYWANTPGGAMPDGSPVHALAFYANPILPKPVASPTNTIVTVNPADSSATTRLTAPDPATYNTLVFAAGVHNIGPGFQVQPGKNYYIPGDAILYGNISNDYAPSSGYRSRGDRINIFGYGTLCGIQIPHYQYRANNPEYPEWNAWTNRNGQSVGISINNAWDTKITGISIADPANFNTAFGTELGATNNQNLVSWVKLHSWRVNGDGFGGYAPVEDSFIRASDDSTYVRDWRRRCTFWKDSNANIFRFINYKSGGLDDCDVLYARWRDSRGVGSVFEFAGGSYAKVSELNLTIRNIRFHDKHSNPSRLFSMALIESYKGLVFENISAYVPKNGKKSIIMGSESAPWYERLVFKNVTFKTSDQSQYDTGTLLTATNFNNYFETNEFVKYVLFDHPRNLTVAIMADSAKGFVTKIPNQATHVETTLTFLTATPEPGYEFTGWVGLNQEDPTTNPMANPATIRMLENRNITANFGLASIADPVVITVPRSGSWVVPAGVYSATIQAWGGGGAGGSAEHTVGATNVSIRGGGGTGGSFSSRTLQILPGQIINFTVGAGGVGSTLGAGQTYPSDSNSGDGFGSSATVNGQNPVSAIGGLGGKNKSGTSSSSGGGGRTAPTSGNIGDLFYYGGNGAGASANGTGGGGGSAGSLARGGDAGGAPWGGSPGPGGGAWGASGHNGTSDGNVGSFPGGGGSGAGVRNNGSGTLKLTGGRGGDGKIIVTYNTVLVSLTTQADNGSILRSPSTASYPTGSTVSLTAVPNPGYQFADWGGAVSGTQNLAELVMNEQKTVTANFTRQFNGAGFLSVFPMTTFSSVMPYGTPAPFPTKTYTLHNSGLTPIDWAATQSVPWLTLSSSSGTLAAGAYFDVIASINSDANALSVGSYTATIAFTNTTNGYGNAEATRSVSLRMSAPPTINVGAERTVTFNPPTPWTPAEINPAAWYDASDPATIIQSGGSVSEWRSKSGTSHLLQAVASKQPSTGTKQINGLNSLAFDGTGDTLKTATNPFGSTIQNGMFMGVINIGTLTPSSLFSLTGDGPDPAKRWQPHAPFSDGNIYFDCAGTSGDNRLQVATAWSANQNKLLGFYNSEADDVQQIWESGNLLKGDATGHAVNTDAGIVLGQSGVDDFDNCTMGEVVIIDGVVSYEGRQILEGYLAHKWGFASTLPINHPYKLAPLGAGTEFELSGINSNDLENDTLAYAWTLVSGPPGIIISDPGSLNPSLVFSAPGIYTLRLTVSDGYSQVSENVVIRLVENVAPVVSLGPDQSTALTRWTPGNLNPVAWYDATDPSTISQSGGSISEWRSKVGTSHMLQASTSKRPSTGTSLINGFNAIAFDGADDALKTATNPFGSSIQDALLMAVTNIGANTPSTLFSLSGSSANAAQRFQAHAPFSDGRVYFDVGGASGANRLLSTSTWGANQNKLLGFYGSATTNVQQVWDSGTLLMGDATGHTVSIHSGLALGHDGASAYDNCTMGEVVILNGVVSTENRQRLEGYLGHKWELLSSLPAEHPYKLLPPNFTNVNLWAMVSDANNDPLTHIWSVVSGPADDVIENANSLNARLVTHVPGTYTLRLTVNDGVFQTIRAIVIEVLGNTAPTVSAGSDQAATLTDWTPAILNPVAWYDATDPSTISQSDGSVSGWRSKVGSNHMLQASTSKLPSTGSSQINGLNAIAFDGIDDALKTTTNPFGSTIQNAMFMTVTNIGVNTPSTLFSLSGLGSENARRFQAHAPFNDGKVYFDVGGASPPNRVQSSSTWSANQSKLLGFYSSVAANVQQVWDSGTLFLGDTSGHTVSTHSGIALGHDGVSSFDNCTMGEVVILNGVVTTENRQKLEGYLGHKWGLSSNFPVDHPHKLLPPDAANINLSGTASDLNNDSLIYHWSVVTGPSGFVIRNANSLNAILSTHVPGSYTLRLTVSDGSSRATDDVTIQLGNLTPYQIWASGSFTHPFTLTGVMEDPDADGQKNLLEFGFGTDPTRSTSQPLSFVPGGNVTLPGMPSLTIVEGNPATYHADFTRRKDHAMAGISYRTQFSADMKAWTHSAVGLSVMTHPSSSGELEIVRVPFPESVPTETGGTAPPIFFRVSVTNN